MRISMLLAVLSAFLFGSATPISKLLLDSINPFQLAGLLYLGAGLALVPIVARRGFPAKLHFLDRKNRLYVIGSITCGGIGGPVFLLFGLQAAKSASVSLWLNLELVATLCFGHLFFKDRMTRSSALTALGIACASVLLSFDGGVASVAGGLFVAAACLAWGIDNNLTSLIDGLKPQESTFVKGTISGATNLIVGLLVFPTMHLAIPSVGAALLVGALSYGLSIVLFISTAQGLGASRAQLFFASSPLFGLFLAILILGESISTLQLIAIALMAVSYPLLPTERHAHAHSHPAIIHTHWHKHNDMHHMHEHVRLSLWEIIFGHSHEHSHEPLAHDHVHVPDIHHRHTHGSAA
jgi:drug/metabolite transporter (DMT)-like permease